MQTRCLIYPLRNKLFAQGLLVFSQVLFPLITYPIVTKALGAQGLGKVNFADSIVQFVLIVSSIGIPLYGLREVALHKEINEKSRIFKELFTLQLLMIVPAIGLVWFVGLVSQVSTSLLWAGSMALVASSLTCEWWFQGNGNFFYIAVRSLVIRSVAAGLVFLWVRHPDDAFLYYLILAGSVTLTMLINLAIIFPQIKTFRQSSHPTRHFGAINWIFACYVLASLYSVLDSLLLGWLSTDTVVGYYSFGYRLIRMCSMLVPTLGIVFVPAITYHFASSNTNELKNQVDASRQIILFFGIPMSLFFLVMAPEIVSVFANEHFHPSVTVLRVLSPVPLLVSFSHLTGTQLLISIKKEKIYFNFLITGCIIDIISNVLLIPRLHENGAAVSNLLTETFIASGTFLYLKKSGFMALPFKELMSRMYPALLLVPLAYTTRYFNMEPIITLMVGCTLTAIVYLAVHYRFISSKWIR